MYKISIIIPIYNVAQYIVRCLDSVAKQTYKGEIECILVDDCGPDNSAEICEEYIKSYNGKVDFKLVYRETNGGLSAARNSGTMMATGDYLYYLDSDDEIPTNAMELMAAEVEKHPGVDVVMGFMYDDRHESYYNLDCYKNHQYVTDNRWLQYNSFCSGKIIPVNGCNKLVRKSFIEEHNLYFKTGIIHEDDHWMFYLVKHVKTWAFVFEPTYIRYWNEGSIMTGTNQEKEVRNWFLIMLDHSVHFYEPFYTLQLARYMDRYFCRAEFLHHYPESRQLHLNFIRACLHQHLWKETFLLTLFTCLYWFRSGSRSASWVSIYAQKLYKEESERTRV